MPDDILQQLRDAAAALAGLGFDPADVTIAVSPDAIGEYQRLDAPIVASEFAGLKLTSRKD